MSNLGRLFAALLVVICVTAAIFVAGLVLTIDGLRRDLAAVPARADVIAFHSAPAAQGGTGAVLVLLAHKRR